MILSSAQLDQFGTQLESSVCTAVHCWVNASWVNDLALDGARSSLTMTSSSIGVLTTALQPTANALLRRRDSSLFGESWRRPLRVLWQTCSAGRNCKLLLVQLSFRQQTTA